MTNGNAYGENRPAAPDFPPEAEWINTDRPLTMQDLRGRVVLLDFWTYCCINCMHVLPDLAKLEEKYGDRLIVVGVHSAKFTGERDSGNIREAVKRYNIRHPVVNDAGMVLWNKLGVRSWPTLILVDPGGNIVGKVSGEGNYDILDRAIGDLIEGFAVSGEGLSPLPGAPEVEKMPETFLKYPGKVFADPAGNRLFIADSGHNRIVVADLVEGDVFSFIGSGNAGLRDGGFEDAEFSNPQGMALNGSLLYIADTDNHALRVVDLDARRVTTVAGTGAQAHGGARGGLGKNAVLNSPWDVVMLGGMVYIAMAGAHQIWRYDSGSKRVEVYAGSGREDIIDASLESAALAQPSGITTDGRVLYFADSETSSIRKIENGRVVTLIGKGLFTFGDEDGLFRNALLQHPLGVVYDNNIIWVADTYNNRLRRMHLAESTIVTVAGADEDGFEDGIAEKARFDEPGGLTMADGRVYIADTNNHAVRIYDPLIETVTTYNLAETVSVVPESDSFTVRVFPPEGYHINTDASSTLDVSALGGERKPERTVSVHGEELQVSVRCGNEKPGAVFEFSGDIYLCRKGEKSVCTVQSFSFRRKLRISGAGSGETGNTYTLPVVELESSAPVGLAR